MSWAGVEQLHTLLRVLARCPGHICEQAVHGEGDRESLAAPRAFSMLPFPCQVPGTPVLSRALFCSPSDSNAVCGCTRLLPAWLTSGCYPPPASWRCWLRERICQRWCQKFNTLTASKLLGRCSGGWHKCQGLGVPPVLTHARTVGSWAVP